jgi:exportin-2 (importin alpha re-exporter)
MQQYFRGVIMTLLTRMQSSKTDNFVYHFVCFLAYVLAVPVQGLTPDYLVQAVEAIQPG